MATAEAEAPAATEFDDATKSLGDQIAGLTLLQAKSLVDYLKEAHGIEPAAGGAVMVAGPAGGGDDGGGGGAEEKTEFDVVMTGFGDKKMAVIKAVRQIDQSLGLKDAKALVEGVPATIKQGVSKDEAEEVKKTLEEAGASVELK